jgi:hypothetical protein
MMEHIKAFLGEYHYCQAQELYRLLDEHPWSRRLSQRDAGAVAEAQRLAQILASDLYYLREELEALLAAAPRLLEALEAIVREGDPVTATQDWPTAESFAEWATEQTRAALQAAERIQ